MLKKINLPVDSSLVFLFCISFFGLALSFVFVFISGKNPDDFELRKPLVGSIFGILCVLGTFASIYPDSCLRVLDYEKGTNHEKVSRRLRHPTIRGHHPACGKLFCSRLESWRQDSLCNMHRFLCRRSHCSNQHRAIFLRVFKLRNNTIHTPNNRCLRSYHGFVAFSSARFQNRFFPLHRKRVLRLGNFSNNHQRRKCSAQYFNRSLHCFIEYTLAFNGHGAVAMGSSQNMR